MSNPDNNYTLRGNLTKAPVLRETENGKHYTFLNIAVNSGYGDKARTDYFSVVVWGKQAEDSVEFLVKGQSVSVSAELRSVMGKDKKLHTKIQAEEVKFGPKPHLAKDKEQTAEAEKTDAVKDEPVEDPSPVELPEEYFSNEPSEEPDMDI
ncbi:MAG: single-stranded DNA-binding protein [Saccharofermentans sp.]|nr:single-stranded DNA-binding protein [Saccharofermentans sp.]